VIINFREYLDLKKSLLIIQFIMQGKSYLT